MSLVYDWFGSHTKNDFEAVWELHLLLLSQSFYSFSKLGALKTWFGRKLHFRPKIFNFRSFNCLDLFSMNSFLSLHSLLTFYSVIKSYSDLFPVSFAFSFPSIDTLATQIEKECKTGKVRKCNNNWNSSVRTIHSSWTIDSDIFNRKTVSEEAAPPFLFSSFERESQLLNFLPSFRLHFWTNRENSVEPLWKKTGKIKEIFLVSSSEKKVCGSHSWKETRSSSWIFFFTCFLARNRFLFLSLSLSISKIFSSSSLFLPPSPSSRIHFTRCSKMRWERRR